MALASGAGSFSGLSLSGHQLLAPALGWCDEVRRKWGLFWRCGMGSWRRGVGALAGVAVLGVLAVGSASAGVRPLAAKHERRAERRVTHVLLISVDGFHQSDLEWY